MKGLERILAELRRRAEEQLKAVGTVGFTEKYAIWVHERLDLHHPVGQAKFLEEPMRTRAKELNAMIADGLKHGLTMKQSIYRACLALQGWAQKLCPVDTNALRASAFTRVE